MNKKDRIPKYKLENLQNFFGQQPGKNDYFFADASEHIFFDKLPFRTETYGLAFLQKGGLLLQAGLEKTAMKAPAIFAMGPSIIRSFEPSDIPPTLKVIFFTQQFFTQHLADIFFLTKFKFFDEYQRHIFPLNQIQQKRFMELYDQIEHLLLRKNLHEAMMIKGYLIILIHEIDNMFYQLQHQSTQQNKKQLQLLQHFKQLLSLSFKEEHGVGYYAERLHVTSKYLSDYLKQHTGNTAGWWITQTLVLEAKVLLLQKDLSVAQVSDQLHFSDQTVFGKFFKINTGFTPVAFKKG